MEQLKKTKMEENEFTSMVNLLYERGCFDTIYDIAYSYVKTLRSDDLNDVEKKQFNQLKEKLKDSPKYVHRVFAEKY